jgi:hypothetical protein
MSLKQNGIIISYLIGAPTGIITIFVCFTIPVMLTGEGLSTIFLIDVYGKSILGLIISFLIVLGFAGHLASIDIEKRTSLLKTSFKYSLTVNAIIWLIFIVLTFFNREFENHLLIVTIPILAFIICTIITTFTVGLLICYLIKRRISNVT